MSTVAGWALYLAIVAIGLGSVVATTVWAHGRLQARGSHGIALGVWTTVVAIAALGGLWIVADLLWLARWASGQLRGQRPRA
jgi:hypothetical protein